MAQGELEGGRGGSPSRITAAFILKLKCLTLLGKGVCVCVRMRACVLGESYSPLSEK